MYKILLSLFLYITGYTAEGTIGRYILDAKEEILDIFGIKVLKKARVKDTSEYSGHAKINQIIAFLQEFTNIRFVAVNHGEKAIASIEADRILDEVKTRNVGILNRDYFFRIDPYGYVKSMTTKFD